LKKFLVYRSIKFLMSSPINVIYFHYPCQDGLASAWVATKSLKDYNLVFHKHGNTYNTDYSNKTIYFLNRSNVSISWSRGVAWPEVGGGEAFI
jgi:hypothetical protein